MKGLTIFRQRTTRMLSVIVALLSFCLAPLTQADNVYFVHTDHLGTPVVITDDNQQVVWQGNKNPFGETSVTTNQIEFNVRFPGQYYDAESGLHYNYFRDYDPGLGRYVQSDPIGLRGGLNTYAYVRGNPLTYIDPLGLASIAACANPANAAACAAAGITPGSIGSAASNGATVGLGLCSLTGLCSPNESSDDGTSEEGKQCPVEGGEHEGTTTRYGTDVWGLPGSYEDAVGAAEGLAVGGLSDKGDGVKVGTDANGNTIIVRPGGGEMFGGTKANGTIEIQPAGGGRPTDKIRFR